MRTVWRIRFTWTFAVLFSFLSVMGEGLHLLPGQGHDTFCGDFDGCDDDGGCLTDVNLPSLPSVNFRAVASIAASSAPFHADCGCDACAICKFMSQSLWFAPTPMVLHWEFFEGFQRPENTIKIFCRQEHLLFQSRAPPLGAAC
jgi:hypothetical protein